MTNRIRNLIDDLRGGLDTLTTQADLVVRDVLRRESDSHARAHVRLAETTLQQMQRHLDDLEDELRRRTQEETSQQLLKAIAARQ